MQTSNQPVFVCLIFSSLPAKCLPSPSWINFRNGPGIFAGLLPGCRTGRRYIVVDPLGPRVLTLDPWPQTIFIAADGQQTIEAYVYHMAKQYSGKAPAGLASTILHEINTLLGYKLIELCEVQQYPDPSFYEPRRANG